MHDLVASYSPLLACPACSPPARLVAPTTLHCGHTVCAKHVRTEHANSPSASSSASSSSFASTFLSSLSSGSHASSSRPSPGPASNASSSVPVLPACPLPTCRPRARRQFITPNIPPESTVAYYPPIVQPTPEPGESNRITVSDPRLDVSIGRVLYLLEKAGNWQSRENYEPRLTEESDGTDDESQGEDRDNEFSLSQPGSRPRNSNARRRSRPASRTQKRSRNDGDWDGSHYRHRTREELVERFNKELSESLTCEICFMLLYQPVTTPCQHVRLCSFAV